MKYLLGSDIGTSGTKTVLFDLEGRAVASHTAEYPLYQPHNGWAEQEPEDWWNGFVEGVKAVIAESGADASDIGGIGLSGQMHGLVMLGKNDEVLRRSIIWCDQRTAKECAFMEETVGRKRLIEITANPAMTGFTASKILWVMRNEPEVYEKCVKIMLPKDYIRYRLTGEFATEVSDASGMQLMDVAGRCWSDELLSLLSIDKGLLGKMYESPDVTGRVSESAANITGLAKDTPVAGGAGDNAAAAIGAGVCRQGSAFNTIGSSAVIYAVSDKLNIDLGGRVHSLCASVPGKWTVMSCTQAAGISLKWLRDTCCSAEIEEAVKLGVDPYVIMDKMAAEIPAGADKLIYLPYLMGERSPHPDSDCRGVFFGLSAMHTRAHLIRSVLEGVAFSQRECMDVFKEMGVPVDDMTVCGGGGRSKLWRQILSDVYGCNISVLNADEGGALGAALLAGVGAGAFESVEQACEQVVSKRVAAAPDKVKSAEYEPYFDIYKKLYLSLKNDFAALAQI